MLQVVSPRNHMVFTPLLPSTCVGTIEPRSVALPFVRLQKGFSLPYNSIFGGCAENVDPAERSCALRQRRWHPLRCANTTSSSCERSSAAFAVF